MRFVLISGLFALLCSDSSAAPWDIVPTSGTAPSAVTTSGSLHMQRGPTSNKLQTIEGLELERVVTGLGYISALAINEDGTIFATDQRSGRIWVLPDRRQDGKVDLRRPLAFKFDRPSGLAVLGDVIYVADKNAVWVIEPERAPKELASLRNADSTDGPHILLTEATGEYLILGLTKKTEGFRVLELKTETGEALLIGEGDYGDLYSLARRRGSELWAGSGASLGPLGSEPLDFLESQSIKAIALPGQYEQPDEWPAQLKDHIIAAQTGPGAMQLIAIPTEFGLINGAPRSLVEGFLTHSGRSAWGQPGPLIMDKRGLFFADSHNGTLWRLSVKPSIAPKIKIVDTENLPALPNDSPKLTPQDKTMSIGSSIQGTQIDASSTIVQPSSITYGSKIIKDYDEKEAAEDAEKTETEPKKKRRMSRKRKQPVE